MLVRRQKKKRGLITSSTFFEVSPNTLQSLTSKSPRHRREHPCFYSWIVQILAKFRRTRFKRTLQFSLRRTPSRLGITQASLVLLSLLRHFLYVFCLCYVIRHAVLVCYYYCLFLYHSNQAANVCIRDVADFTFVIDGH